MECNNKITVSGEGLEQFKQMVSKTQTFSFNNTVQVPELNYENCLHYWGVKKDPDCSEIEHYPDKMIIKNKTIGMPPTIWSVNCIKFFKEQLNLELNIKVEYQLPNFKGEVVNGKGTVKNF